MLGLRKPSNVLTPYASQMFSKSTSEASLSFTDIEVEASAAGYAVHEIFRHACKMFTDDKGAFRCSYLGEMIDVFTTRALTCT